MAIKRYVYSFYQKCKERYLRGESSHSKVLMLHQVNDNKNLWQDEFCSITQKAFTELICGIMEQGYTFCPLSDIGNNEREDRSIFITFDDAYADVYVHCYPLLKKHNIPFTVFMAVDYLGKKDYLSAEMIKEMMKSGLCTIASHTVSHRMLRCLNKEQAQWEIAASREKLGAIFETGIEYFAYPYGSIFACSKDNVYAAKRAGYKMAFSTINSALPRRIKETFFLPRINVNEKNYRTIIEGCR